jgi:8-oxo-dGTP pyrophosphatase MutT (NUDIX family)
MRRALLQQVSGAPAGLPEALIAAALREAEEEAGLSLSQSGNDIPALRFIGRAITPPGMPKRFDTRFFLIERAHFGEARLNVAGPDDELTELLWVTIEETQSLPLHQITRLMLERAAACLSDPDDTTPIPFYQERRGHRVMLPITPRD